MAKRKCSRPKRGQFYSVYLVKDGRVLFVTRHAAAVRVVKRVRIEAWKRLGRIAADLRCTEKVAPKILVSFAAR